MATPMKPGTSTGPNGGIFQEIGPRGGARPNYTTVRDNERLPPTTTPGAGWKPIDRTPNSKR